jgi:putative transposase
MGRPGTNVAAKAGLNRSILDAGWGQIARFLTYKAASAGRCVERVNAPYTSQTCARCGHTDARSRVSREHFCCVACGHRAHADANAAEVILALATGRLVIARPARQRNARPGSGHRSATTGRDAA